MTFQYIYRNEDEKTFLKLWDGFVEEHGVGPSYLSRSIDFMRAYAAHDLRADHSFVMRKGDRTVACAFLPVTEEGGFISVAMPHGEKVSAPIFRKKENGTEKAVMETIDAIARRERIDRITFQIDPLERDSYPYNYLINHGYLDASLLGYVADCEHPGMRRNHQRAIRKIERDSAFSIYVMDRESIVPEAHAQYVKLHRICSGLKTRPQETYDLQFDLLREGHAILVGLKYQNEFIAFTYFTYHGTKAVSYSAADKPDFDSVPLYHIINARALEYFRAHGVKEMDFGQPLTTSHQFFYHPTEKQKNISLFKTGFNGRFVENFQGVKYFSQKLFEEDIKNFMKNYQISE